MSTTTIVLLLTPVVAAIASTLWDLSRREVRHLPKWAWALIIVAVSFPIGVVLYFVVGRKPPGEDIAPIPAQASVQVAAWTAPQAVTGAPVVVTTGLRKVYGETEALAGVNLVVPRGSVYGLIGPNEAGKTTLFSILAGLRQPSAGAVELAVDRRAVAVMPDTPQFEPWLTAREVVDLSRHLVSPDLPATRVDEALARARLSAVMDRRVAGFSRGMLQRLGLASSLVTDPQVLILDEPSSALDPSGRREVLDLIGELAATRTVILSTHILADVQQVCDTVGVIHQGCLLHQGPLADLLAQTASAYDLHVRAPADGVLAALGAAPWVTTVEERAPGRIRLVVNDSHRAEAELPTLIAASGARLVSANPATDLETAFMEMIA